jgi:hypothetical protein
VFRDDETRSYLNIEEIDPGSRYVADPIEFAIPPSSAPPP